MTPRPASSCEVAVIGAGPYGLSVAAHLKHAGIATRVFGEPMAFWRHNMPRGMLLRSPWDGTHISNPERTLSLAAYAAQHGISTTERLPLEQFVAYGEWFQQHAVPDVDRRTVCTLDATQNGFRLTLADGGVVTAARVVIATGLNNQEYRPEVFDGLPATLVSHCCEHTDLAIFRGKRVAVIGRGQSACESAALLAEAGAEAEVISRGEIHWLGGSPGKSTASWLQEALKSPSEIGPFPLSWLVEVPGLVWHLPRGLREEFTRRCLKPGASGWIRPRFADVMCNPGRTIAGARAVSDRVVLDLDTGASTFDHVLLGTGYRIDIARLGIFSPQLLDKIARIQGSPALGRGFESSVPNLHFVGSAAVKSFGPILRFIAGAPFAARSVTEASLRGHTGKSVATSQESRGYSGGAPNPSPSR